MRGYRITWVVAGLLLWSFGDLTARAGEGPFQYYFVQGKELTTGASESDIESLPPALRARWSVHIDELKSLLLQDGIAPWLMEGLIVPPGAIHNTDSIPVLRVVFREQSFASGDSKIRPAAIPALKVIARFLSAVGNDAVAIIAGHTDDRGSDVYNFGLATRRAMATSRFLVGSGVNSKAITIVGLGAVVPMFSNWSEEGRTGNRRVEFFIGLTHEANFAALVQVASNQTLLQIPLAATVLGKEPFFPWPPPPASARTTLPESFLSDRKRFSKVVNAAEFLEHMLAKGGFDEWSYFSLPDEPAGFGLVSRMEQIDAKTALPLPGVSRWTAEANGARDMPVWVSLFSIFRPVGHYRLFVFMLSRKPTAEKSSDRTEDQATLSLARKWTGGGSRFLQKNIASLPITSAHRLTVRVYEFEQEDKGPSTFVETSPWNATQHLTAAGLQLGD